MSDFALFSFLNLLNMSNFDVVQSLIKSVAKVKAKIAAQSKLISAQNEKIRLFLNRQSQTISDINNEIIPGVGSSKSVEAPNETRPATRSATAAYARQQSAAERPARFSV